MHPLRIYALIFPLASASTSLASESESPDAIPPWLRTQLQKYKTMPAYKAPLEVWKITHKGQAAYFIISPCCDRYNPLFSAEGKKICNPTGGKNGKGDSKCPTPVDKGTKVIFVWAHPKLSGKPRNAAHLGSD